MNDLPKVTAGAPPLLRFEMVAGDGVDNGGAAGVKIFGPQQAHATSVSSVCDNNDLLSRLGLQNFICEIASKT